MALVKAKWITKDQNTLEVDESGNLKVKLDDTGALNSTGNGIGIKVSGITAENLAGGIPVTKLLESVLLADGSQALTGDLDLGGHTITNAVAGDSPNSVVTKQQLDSLSVGIDLPHDVLGAVDMMSAPPVSTMGARYIVTGVTNPEASWGTIPDIGVNDIVEFNGTAWTRSWDASENPGAITWNAAESVWFSYDGVSWSEHSGINNTTAGSGLSRAGGVINVNLGHGLEFLADDIQLHLDNLSGLVSSATGVKILIDETGAENTAKAINITSNGLSVKVDEATLEGDPITGQLRVKEINGAQLKADGVYDFTNATITVPTRTASDNSEHAASTEYVEQANLDIQAKIDLLAPEKPENLSSKTLTVSGTYNVLTAGTGVPRINVTSDTTPKVSISGNEGFFDGASGTLTANVGVSSVNSGVPQASGAIALIKDMGVTNDNMLTVLETSDFHEGVAGAAGFWYQAKAEANLGVIPAGDQYTVSLEHSATGSTPIYTGYIDTPATPTVGSVVANFSGSSRVLDGVPSIAAGETIEVDAVISNAVGKHYRDGTIAQILSNAANTKSITGDSITPPAEGADISLSSESITVASNKAVTGATVTARGYNTKGVSGTHTINTSLYVDTMNAQPSNRRLSGEGQYPTTVTSGAAYTGLTANWLPTTEELQWAAGKMQYPLAIDYSAYLPVGPNNTGGVLGASYGSDMRWATFELTNVTDVSNFGISFEGMTGITVDGDNQWTGAELYLQVRDGVIANGQDGTTVGWLDANTELSTGQEAVQGSFGCLKGSESTSTYRRVSFKTPKTGTVLVRIGLPAGSPVSFTGVSFDA